MKLTIWHNILAKNSNLQEKEFRAFSSLTDRLVQIFGVNEAVLSKSLLCDHLQHFHFQLLIVIKNIKKFLKIIY